MSNLSTKFKVILLLLSISLYSFAIHPNKKDDKKQKNNIEATLKKNFEQISFEQNKGQMPSEVLFLGKAPQLQARFMANKVSFAVQEKSKTDEKSEAVKGFVWNMNFLGANSAKIKPSQPRAGVFNYLQENQQATNVKSWSELRYEKIYDNIDLRFYSEEAGLMEYDFILYPSASVANIRFEMEGVEGLRIDDKGNLVFKTPLGELSKSKPYAYQTINGKEKEIKVAPIVMQWSTFLGDQSQNMLDIELDAAGNVYVLSEINTGSAYPITAGAFQTSNAGQKDIIITKIDKDGSTLKYSTFFGGTGWDSAYSLEVNAAGEAYFVSILSNPMATTAGALDIVPVTTAGAYYLYFTKLNATGTALVYNARFGFNGQIAAMSGMSGTKPTILVNSAGELLFASDVYPTVVNGFYTTPGARPVLASNQIDAIALKLNASGSGLVYCTSIGGSGLEIFKMAKLDAAGNLFLFGETSSNDFLTTACVIQSTFGGGGSQPKDAFISKFSPTGTLLYSTYLGGNGGSVFGGDTPDDMCVSPAGEVHVVLGNASGNLPTSSGAVQPVYLGEASSQTNMFGRAAK